MNDADFGRFIKNIKTLEFICMRSITEELNTPDWSSVQYSFYNENDCVKWLIAMRAFENLRSKGHDLGEDESNQDAEYTLMRQECDAILALIGAENGVVEEKYIRELLRFGTAKIHNISAYMGGVAAQEGLKLLMD